jgi:hypothetical protein
MAIPLIILLGPLVVGVMHNEVSRLGPGLLEIHEGQERKANLIWMLAEYQNLMRLLLNVALGGYLLSFVDVIMSYYSWGRLPAREARARPSPVALSQDVITAEESPAVHTVLRYDGTNAGSPAQDMNPPGEPIHEDTSGTSVYVHTTEGIPLYRSLPASDNWSVWLGRGSRLSLLTPAASTASIGRYGHYLQVVDSQGNTGYVSATTVSLDPPTGDDHTPSAAMVEEPETG